MVETGKEEIPGSKHSMYAYTDLLQALKGEPLSSVFSPDGTLISASAAPHCGDQERQISQQQTTSENVKSHILTYLKSNTGRL